VGIFIDWVKGQVSTSELVNAGLNVLGTAAVNGACTLRSKYPNRFLSGGVLDPVMDRICDANGFGVSPTKTVTVPGGQCPVTYDVRASCKVVSRSINSSCGNGPFYEYIYPSVDTTGKSPIIQGPISALQFVYSGGDPKRSGCGTVTGLGKWEMDLQITDSEGVKTYKTTLYRFNPFSNATTTFSGSIYLEYDTITEESFVFTRDDGQPDDCGELTELPPDAVEDPADFTVTVPVCGTPDDPDDQRCVDVDIVFEPELDENGEQCFTVGGDRYCFTPDGPVKKEPSDEAPGTDEPTVEEPAEDEEEAVENLQAIKVDILAVPANESSVVSGDTLTKIYPGWVIFKEGSYHYPRQFIDFRKNIFPAPANANGFIVYLKPGYTGTITKVVKETS